MDSSLTKQMKHAISTDLKSRYSVASIFRLLKLNSYLDPRFRNRFSKSDYPNSTSMIEGVYEELAFNKQFAERVGATAAQSIPTTLPQEAQSTSDTDGPSTATAFPNPVAKEKAQLTKASGLAGILKRIANKTQEKKVPEDGPLDLKAKLKEENAHLAMPLVPDEIDPLSWWNDYATDLSPFSSLVKKLFCIPATSVQPECVFSPGRNILTPFQSRLTMLVFLHQNLKT
ncbi:UNVERIFIED_CONTAM: hypothetical protein FKN15_076866 [Acipenser sinensis]